MRCFLKIFCCTAISLYTSCARHPDPANNGNAVSATDTPASDSDAVGLMRDTAKTVSVDLTAKSSVRIDTNAPLLQNWQKFLRERGKNFSLKNFYAATMGTIDIGGCNTWDGKGTEDCACSPDSTMYATTVPGLCGDEPDTYVYLFDKKNKTWCELATAGSFTTYEDCEWEDDSTLIVYGYDTYDAEQEYPDQNYVQGFYVVYNFSSKKEICYASKNYFRLK